MRRDGRRGQGRSLWRELHLNTGLRIEPLARHLDLVTLVAGWHWDAWGHAHPGGSIDRWADGLRQRANPERIPITWLAFVRDVPVAP